MIFLQTFIVIFVVAAIQLVLYALTKTGRDFDIFSWLLLSRTRLGLGLILILLLSFLIAFVPEANIVLNAVGFDTGASNAALGLAVGGLLVSLIRGDE